MIPGISFYKLVLLQLGVLLIQLYKLPQDN
jgi:hypothetical protein